MPSPTNTAELTREWPLPADVTLGSSVRAKGVLQQVRTRLPAAARKSLELRGGVLVLVMTNVALSEFESVSAGVAKALEGIETRPVIPREIEDILAIKTSERHRWLKDGRLPSAGTRTVKLRGRAKKITFHIFDPRQVADLLDRDAVAEWREDDILNAAENRRRAAEARALLRRQSREPTPVARDETPEEAARHQLKGWDEFERESLLR